MRGGAKSVLALHSVVSTPLLFDCFCCFVAFMERFAFTESAHETRVLFCFCLFVGLCALLSSFLMAWGAWVWRVGFSRSEGPKERNDRRWFLFSIAFDWRGFFPLGPVIHRGPEVHFLFFPFSLSRSVGWEREAKETKA